MTLHVLKSRKEYWDAVASGEKMFEIRYADRGYEVGDILRLVCLNDDGSCSASEIEVSITYILKDFVGLRDNYWILGICPVSD